MITRLPRTFSIAAELFDLIAWRIVVGCLKGGTAKSTSSLLIATEIHRRTGEKVLIVCADSGSQSIYNYYLRLLASDDGADCPFHVIVWHQADGLAAGVLNQMRQLGCRHVVIDVGGGDNEIFQAACTIGDELIVPVAPNLVELERLEPTIRSAAQVSQLNSVNPNILLVKCSHTGAKAKRAANWLHQDKGWPLLETRIPHQPFYSDVFEGGVPADGGFYGSVLAEIALAKIADAEAALDAETTLEA